MVAHRNRKSSAQAAHAPRPVPTDSDVVVLALVTAQALEAQGEVGEAAAWLRRAADQARREGNMQRVSLLLRAAADMSKTIALAPSPGPSSREPRTPAPSSFVRMTSPRSERVIRAGSGASLREARVFDRRWEARGELNSSTMEATLALMTAAG
jgi:hypothetical protein